MVSIQYTDTARTVRSTGRYSASLMMVDGGIQHPLYATMSLPKDGFLEFYLYIG